MHYTETATLPPLSFLSHTCYLGNEEMVERLLSMVADIIEEGDQHYAILFIPAVGKQHTDH